MTTNCSQEVLRIAEYAREEALRTGHRAVCADHIMLAILRRRDNDACRLLVSLGIDLDGLKSGIDACMMKDEALPFEKLGTILLKRSAAGIMQASFYEALKSGSDTVLSVHLLLALCRHSESATAEYLYAAGIDYDKVSTRFREEYTEERSIEHKDGGDIQKTLGAIGDRLAALFNPESSSVVYPS